MFDICTYKKFVYLQFPSVIFNNVSGFVEQGGGIYDFMLVKNDNYISVDINLPGH